MKRSVLLTAAMGAVLSRSALADNLTISTTTSSAVATATAANASPGNITIGSGGSVAISTAGAAVTLNSNNTLTNSGTISNSVGSSATGVNIIAGNTGSFINAGTINVPGTSPTTSVSQFGVLLSGSGAFTGDIVAATGSTITVSGLSAQAISIQSELAGNLTIAGTLKSTGTSAVGLQTTAAVDGAFTNTGTISVSGGGTSTTSLNPSPSYAVAIGGNVNGGILNSGSVSVVGSSPALILAPAVAGDQAGIGIGVLADANNPGYSFINRGHISSIGVQPTLNTTALQIGNPAGDASALDTTLPGGVYNSGTIIAGATSDHSTATSVTVAPTSATAFVVGANAHIPTLVNDTAGTISATTGGPQGGAAIAISINPGGFLSSLDNAGTISASANATDTTSTTSLAATAIQDSTGALTTIVNSGTISATATALNNGSQSAVAADLSASPLPTTFTNSGTVIGNIVFGSSPSNQLTIEGPHASVTGKIGTTANGMVNLAISAGGTGGSLITNGTIKAGTVTVGPGGTLSLALGTASTIVSASRTASFDAASHLVVQPASVLPMDTDITLVHSDTALTFGNLSATTAGISVPFLFDGGLSSDPKNLILNLRLKSAAELGITGNAATIFEPAMAAAVTDSEFGGAVSTLGSTAAVQSTLAQMLPIMSGADRAIADKLTNTAINEVGLRQNTLTLVPDIEMGSATWAQGFYDNLRDTASNGYSGHGIGIAGGIDYNLPATGHFGAAFTYYRGDTHERDQPEDTSVAQWFMVSPYLGLRLGDFFVNGQFDAGVANIGNSRFVDAGSVVRNPKSSVTEWLAAGGITGGYVMKLGPISLIPEATINALDLAQNGYTEKDGGTGVDLTIKSHNDTVARAFAGITAAGSFAAFNGHIVPQITGGWSQELLKQSPTVSGSFASVAASDFTVTGPSQQRSSLVGGGSLDFVMDKWFVSLGGDASVESKALAETARLTVAARF